MLRLLRHSCLPAWLEWLLPSPGSISTLPAVPFLSWIPTIHLRLPGGVHTHCQTLLTAAPVQHCGSVLSMSYLPWELWGTWEQDSLLHYSCLLHHSWNKGCPVKLISIHDWKHTSPSVWMEQAGQRLTATCSAKKAQVLMATSQDIPPAWRKRLLNKWTLWKGSVPLQALQKMRTPAVPCLSQMGHCLSSVSGLFCLAGCQNPVPVVPRWESILDRWKIG
jgi:hypothetical protein